MLSLLTVGLVGALALADPAAPAPSSPISPAHYLLLNAPDRRVRAPEARVHSLLAEGLHRSRTFASLMTALNHTRRHRVRRIGDDPAEGHHGPFDDDAARRRRFRYLRVQIRADLSGGRPSRSSDTSCGTRSRSPTPPRSATRRA